MAWITNRPLRIILRVQAGVTIILVCVLYYVCGLHSSVSALLGGMIGFFSSAVFALMISRHKGYVPGGIVRTALRAEAVKIILIVVLLWTVFNSYENINALSFISVFVITVLIHSMAFFVSEKQNNSY